MVEQKFLVISPGQRNLVDVQVRVGERGVRETEAEAELGLEVGGEEVAVVWVRAMGNVSYGRSLERKAGGGLTDVELLGVIWTREKGGG